MFATVVTQMGEEKGMGLFREIAKTNGVSVRRPSATNTVRTEGTDATAASAVSFMRTIFPRRVNPSAVTSATAPASCSRIATASAP